MATTKQRITWVDMAKGIGMLFVILAHLDVGTFGGWIYTFHLPLFFFLSGFVCNPDYDFKTFFKKRCKTILIPYWGLGLVMIAYAGAERHTLHHYKSLIIKFFWQRRMSTFWFLACLFFLNFYFYLAKKLLKTNRNLAILSVVSMAAGLAYYHMGGQPLPWNTDVCLTAFPFFFAGYYLKQKIDVVDRFLESNRNYLLTFAGALAVNLVCWRLTERISGEGLDMYWATYGFVPFTLLSAFAGIAVIILTAKKVQIKAVKYVGEFSLLYFAWHQSLMIPIMDQVFELFNFHVRRADGLLAFAGFKLFELLIIVVVLTLICKWIMKTRLKWILGR